ncbi:MAG: carboxypeptidase-like regulatory domain-containing protein [Bacteroidetes bacterium]|nr:carboxypeptidase-like regulatory domain-containing protein [Bacteroidota bacterium]
MKKSWMAIAMVLFWIEASLAQTGMYKGIVKDAVSNQAIEFAVVQLQGTAFGAKTDSAGRFEIRNLKPGLYNIEISNVGF